MKRIVKRFSDLFPWSRIGARARTLWVRTALSGLGLLSLAPESGANPAAPQPAPPTVAVAILDRAKRSPVGKLTLALRGRASMLLAAHGSHSSHSSHSSHYSGR